MTTPRSLLLEAASQLRKAGVPDPVYDAAWMLSSLCGRPPLVLRLDEETRLSDAVLRDFQGMMARRLERIPLQYILKEVPFCGFVFRTDARALIPRPETELMCLWAKELLAGWRGAVSLLDLCCGSGCIGLTMKGWFPSLDVTLSDLSRDALSLAEENARRLGCEVRLVQGDLFRAVSGKRFHMILSNPPYIPSDQCASLQPEVLREPIAALDGGPDGMDFYRRIVSNAADHLEEDGWLLMELGDGEAETVCGLLDKAAFRQISFRRDALSVNRIVCSRAPGRKACHGKKTD